jgi:hypothetical protein
MARLASLDRHGSACKLTTRLQGFRLAARRRDASAALDQTVALPVSDLLYNRESEDPLTAWAWFGRAPLSAADAGGGGAGRLTQAQRAH